MILNPIYVMIVCSLLNRLKLGRPFSEADSSGNSTTSSSNNSNRPASVGGQWGSSSIELSGQHNPDAMGALNGNPSMRSSTGAGDIISLQGILFSRLSLSNLVLKEMLKKEKNMSYYYCSAVPSHAHFSIFFLNFAVG